MSRFLKIIYLVLLAGAIIMSFTMLLPPYVRLQKMQAKVDELRRRLNEKKSECLEHHQRLIDIKSNPKTIEKIAREKFGLCKPGEVVYEYKASAKQETIPEKEDLR